jgi:hypothetical protein
MNVGGSPVSSAGNLFVGDTGNNRIQKKGLAPGSLATIVGLLGNGADQFNQPASIR